MDTFIPYFVVLAALTVLRLDLSMASPIPNTATQPCQGEVSFPTSFPAKVPCHDYDWTMCYKGSVFNSNNVKEYIKYVACEFEMAFDSIADCTIISPKQMKITYTCATHLTPSTIVKTFESIEHMKNSTRAKKFGYTILPGGQHHGTARTEK
jgi:hypothetical protein